VPGNGWLLVHSYKIFVYRSGYLKALPFFTLLSLQENEELKNALKEGEKSAEVSSRLVVIESKQHSFCILHH